MRPSLSLAIALFAAGCAKAGTQNGASGDGGGNVDSCGDLCDSDGDGVVDGSDKCPNTAAGAVVNKVGCADSQLTATLEPSFPPYDLAWSSAGDLGRPGGLTWRYDSMQRGDLFHIYWIICDDPATPCGLALDGAIDMPAESWVYDAADSNLAGGTLVFENATEIALADGTDRPLTGRLTMNITDDNMAPIAFADIATLDVTALLGTYGAEIPGTAFIVTALEEVEDTALVWTPYMDYYDAASTPPAGGGAVVSFGGSFYDK